MMALYVLYWIAVAGLFVYGTNCYVLIFSFLRGRRENLHRLDRIREAFASRVREEELPGVTIQLPIFNERYVVGRLMQAVMRIDYPREKLEVQVLDDSTDDTTAIVDRLVRKYRAQGFRIRHLHRANRDGYKAGALKAGLAASRGELVAVFDTDFVPRPDFLRRAVPFFVDPKLGLVQTRWGHVNEKTNLLTRTQALAIDGHFGIEQAGRCWGNLFLNFNGTAGVWRRSAIEDAGGWHADTLTEDLDLSYRAQLAGWWIEYLLDVEVPAEVPVDMAAFKSQQRRWAKGSIQTAKKMVWKVLASRQPVFVKLQAMVHLTHYLVHPLMLTVALLAVPLLQHWRGPSAPLSFGIMVAFLALSTCGPSALYLAGQRTLRKDWKRRMLWMPGLLVIGTGIAVSNTRAVLEALFGIRSGFVRTPKRNAGPGQAAGRCVYGLPFDPVFLIEVLMSLYSGYGLFLYLSHGKYLIGPFLALYTLGFGFVGFRSIWESWRARRFARSDEAGADLPDTSERDYELVMAIDPEPCAGAVAGART
ncbi:MAG: glycosyltransferase [Planctomycetes bacterium]|nr:glycosyltransferase [Planctomycetota bacterium]